MGFSRHSLFCVAGMRCKLLVPGSGFFNADARPPAFEDRPKVPTERGCFALLFFPARVRTRTETPSDSTGPATATELVEQHETHMLGLAEANIGAIYHAT